MKKHHIAPVMLSLQRRREHILHSDKSGNFCETFSDHLNEKVKDKRLHD